MTRGSILLVDDNPVIRDALQSILMGAGYDVCVAGDGQAAISTCRDRNIDLLITDLIMPEKEGIETIQHFRRTLPHVRIIAMSGGDGAFLKVAQLMGAKMVLPKPIRAAALLEAVQTVLADG